MKRPVLMYMKCELQLTLAEEQTRSYFNRSVEEF